VRTGSTFTAVLFPCCCSRWEGGNKLRIVEMECQPVGPLAKPVFFQNKKNCIIVYDENEAGKTSLVDIMLICYLKEEVPSHAFNPGVLTI